MYKSQNFSTDKKAPFHQLIEFLFPEKKDLLLVATYGVCSGVFSLVLPIAVQTLVNTIGFGSLLQPILVLTVLVFMMLSLSAFLRGLQLYLMEIVQQKLFARLSIGLSKHIAKINYNFTEGLSGPKLINRFFDVLTVQKSTSLIIMDGLSVFLQTVFGMILLAFYHPILLAFDILLIILVYIIVFVLGRGSINSSILESKKKYDVVNWLQDLARLSISGRNRKSQNQLLDLSDEYTSLYISSRKKHFGILFRQVIGALSLEVIASTILLGLGGWLVVKRQLTLGQLVASEIVVTSVVSGVGKFGKYFESYYDLVAATDKIGYLFDLPVESDSSLESVKFSAKNSSPFLKVIDLSYAYEGVNPCFKGVCFEIKSGENLAVFGARASGKSTLCDLIYRLRDPLSGSLEIFGISHKDLSMSAYRSDIIFLRDIDLFDGAILENIRLYNSAASIEEVYKILSELNVLDELKSLPGGLMTSISSGLKPLSDGQAKLIIIARAMLNNPKLVIADCFFDDLDQETCELALNFIIKRSSTSLLYTSRSKTIAARAGKVYSLGSNHLNYQSEIK